MTDTPSSQERPIVRPSHVSVQIDLPRGRRKKNQPPVPVRQMNYAVYGVDADGDKREYVRYGTEEEYKEWEKAGPVWRQAEDAIIGRLLDNPATRDWVIELNALAAYEKGDVDTAVGRFQHCLRRSGIG